MRRVQVLSKPLGATSAVALCLGFVMAGCASPPERTSGFTYSADTSHTSADPSHTAANKAATAPALASPLVVTTQSLTVLQPAEPISSLAVPTGNRETSVLLLEQIGAGEARVGVPYNYQLRVTNLTPIAVTGIVLDQQVPSDFKVALDQISTPAAGKATTQPATAPNPHTRFDIGVLAPHESKTVEITATPTRAGAFDMQLGVRYDPPALYARINVVAPLLKIVTNGPAQADICQEIICQYSVTNVGTGTAHGITLQEKLPDGLLSADTESAFSAPLGDLAPGETRDFTAHLRAVRPGKFATIARVTSTDAPEIHSDELVTAVVAPSLTITITGPRESYFGQPLTYQISVTNRGEAPATRARLRLGATPGHAELVSVESTAGTTLPTIAESDEEALGVIAPGQTRTALAHFQPKEGGLLTADVTALANCTEPAAASASTRIVTVAAPSLTVTHDPEPVAVGNTVIYHLAVQNKGTAPDHDVAVSAILSNSMQLVRAGGGTEAKSESQTVRFAPIPVLQPGQTVTWQVEAKALHADDAQFLASMTSESLPKPVVRLESTTLFGLQSGTVTGSSDAPASAPAPAPPGDLNK